MTDAHDPETIMAAAIMHRGKPHSVPRPGRHHDVIKALRWKYIRDKGFFGTQGFMTNKGRFVDRREAAKIATAADQIVPFEAGGITVARSDIVELFSEDVW